MVAPMDVKAKGIIMQRHAILPILAVFMSGQAEAADLLGPLRGTSQDDGYAAPAEAPRVTGYLQGDYSALVKAPDNVDGHTWSLRGSVNLNTGSPFNLQADANYARNEVSSIDSNTGLGALHGYYRDDQFAVGAFAQASRFSVSALNVIGQGSANDYIGGGELAGYNDWATFYAQLGYGRTSLYGYDADHYVGTLGARFYANDNLRFDVDGALHRFSYSDTDLAVDIRTVKLTANYRPDQLPVTFYGGYRYDYGKLSVPGVSSDDNIGSLFAGLRVSFGTTSLKDEERHGAIWNPISVTP
jgi:hypothetical protein